MAPGPTRADRLHRSRLYFVTDALDAGPRLAELLGRALAGGVDMVQLRDKGADDETLLRAAGVFRSACDEHGAMFWLNDRPDLAGAAGADGVHVGQDDMAVDAVSAVRAAATTASRFSASLYVGRMSQGGPGIGGA